MNRPMCCSKRMNKNGIEGASQRYRCRKCGKNKSITLELAMTGFDIIESSEVLVLDYDHPVNIHGLTDIHHGAVAHDVKKFDRAVQMIKDDPRARWFGNGDMIELIPSHYKINPRGQDLTTDEQVITIGDKLQQISEKCIFIRSGNHELRTKNMIDLDVTMIIAARLGVPLFDLPGYTVVNVNGVEWKLASGHGKSAAMNGELELKKMQAVYQEADVFYLGHDHKLFAEPKPTMRVVDGEEKIKNHWYVRGGSFLRYADYARYAFYPLQKTGWVEMQFSETEINCVVHQ